MAETFAALLFAHVLTGFAPLPGAPAPWIAATARAAAFTLLAWIALGLPPAPALMGAGALAWGAPALAAALIGGRDGGRGLGGLLAGQGAQLLLLGGLAAAWPGAWGQGIWAAPPAALAPASELLAHLPRALVCAAALAAATLGGGVVLPRLMARHDDGAAAQPPEEDDSLPSGGRAIGHLERLLILMLTLGGEAEAIGFLIAAKSVLRFSEIRSRKASEYVIIGTLASFAWAFAVAWGARALLPLVAP